MGRRHEGEMGVFRIRGGVEKNCINDLVIEADYLTA
jgi:hypothetical protein